MNHIESQAMVATPVCSMSEPCGITGAPAASTTILIPACNSSSSSAMLQKIAENLRMPAGFVGLDQEEASSSSSPPRPPPPSLRSCPVSSPSASLDVQVSDNLNSIITALIQANSSTSASSISSPDSSRPGIGGSPTGLMRRNNSENVMAQVDCGSKSLVAGSSSGLEERNCICNICGKGFLKPTHLQRHRLSHTGVRQFKCEHCGKDFYRRDKYNDHMKMHMRKMCHVCNTLFDKIRDLEKHQVETGHEPPPEPVKYIPPPPLTPSTPRGPRTARLHLNGMLSSTSSPASAQPSSNGWNSSASNGRGLGQQRSILPKPPIDYSRSHKGTSGPGSMMVPTLFQVTNSANSESKSVKKASSLTSQRLSFRIKPAPTSHNILANSKLLSTASKSSPENLINGSHGDRHLPIFPPYSAPGGRDRPGSGRERGDCQPKKQQTMPKGLFQSGGSLYPSDEEEINFKVLPPPLLPYSESLVVISDSPSPPPSRSPPIGSGQPPKLSPEQTLRDSGLSPFTEGSTMPILCNGDSASSPPLPNNTLVSPTTSIIPQSRRKRKPSTGTHSNASPSRPSGLTSEKCWSCLALKDYTELLEARILELEKQVEKKKPCIEPIMSESVKTM